MKDKIIVTVFLALFLTSCASKTVLRHEFDKNYDYDRLYSSAMLAVNDSGFSVEEHDKAEGVIKGQDLTSIYYVLNAGVFIVLPWVCTVDRHPYISVVLAKAGDKIILSANKVFSATQKNTLDGFVEKIVLFYESFDGSKSIMTKPEPANQSKPEVIKTADVYLKADLSWDNERGLTVYNNDISDWTQLVLSVEYQSILETENFTYPAGTLKAGGKITVKKALFKSGDGIIKRNDRPAKIRISCVFEDGKKGSFESK